MTTAEPENRLHAIDYRKLRLSNLNSEEFKHLKLLIYWPIYGVMFLFVERFYQVDSYTVMYTPLDDLIPFCEWFVIPYMFWFIYLVGMHLYTLLFDVEAFKKLMKFIIITYSASIIIYLIFPNCQELRPESFERDNALTRFMSGFYQFDTNTNVCPSLHVIGSLAVLSTALNCETIKSKGIKLAFTVAAVLISISTVFLKQHSVIDLIVALPICAVAYYFSFARCKKERTHK